MRRPCYGVVKCAASPLLALCTFIIFDNTVGEHDSAAGVRSDLRVVCDDDDRGALLPIDAAQQFHHLAAGAAVKRAGRLVGENDPASRNECPRDGNALLLTAGKL